jgi:hypothetical protein
MADVVDHPSATRNSPSLDKLQVENGRSRSSGRDLAIFLISRRCGKLNFGGRPPLYFGYSELNPSALKLWIIADPVLAGERHLRDRGHVHALG